MATSTTIIPRKLPLLLVADNVLLPGSSLRIPVHSLSNMSMVKSRLLGRNTLSSTVIGVVPRDDTRHVDDLTSINKIGTAAVVVQVTGTNWPQPAYSLLLTGLCRFHIDEILQETPYPVGRVTQLESIPGENDKNELDSNLLNMAEDFRVQVSKLVDMLDVSVPVVAKLKKMLDSLPNQQLPDVCTSIVKTSFSEKMQVLDAVDLTERFKITLPLLLRQIEGLNYLKEIGKKPKLVVRRPPSQGSVVVQRGSKQELASNAETEDEDEDDMAELKKKIEDVKMSEEALASCRKEWRRLKKMPQQMPEHAMLRNYLDLMVELPWSKSSQDSLDIAKARPSLDEDHYGLDKVKKRIVEYLAVRQLKNSLKGPILCFVGPPGVGKTSIGRSIANCLGRNFHRIALGGVCDQSDIRGHRRTYIGSMPGRIIQGLRLVNVNNPVFLLDEIDKLTSSLHGDPSAALLEVLDPEQNSTFTDHYINVPFDLSQVLFIATANSRATIPPALLDRMELIELPGYTYEEKLHICSRHLLPKQLEEHGLTKDQLEIPADSISLIISKYTREAGVRTLERRIAAICRAVAVKVAENVYRMKIPDKRMLEDKKSDDHLSSIPPELPIVIDENAIEDILGPSMYESELMDRLSTPGVAIGLAWTQMGGEIMFVEASKVGAVEGRLTLTGQLGDIMKESANLALNWVRAKANQLGLLEKDDIGNSDVHIHFPAGAVSKDGPSAGVTIATVLVSIFSDRCVRSDTAMTGEITLRGLVLPVGGIKEKVLAAHQAGLSRVILPSRNAKDLHEVPDSVKSSLTFIFVSRLEEVLNAAFDDSFPKLAMGEIADISSKL